jgi:hypothetical protein
MGNQEEEEAKKRSGNSGKSNWEFPFLEPKCVKPWLGWMFGASFFLLEAYLTRLCVGLLGGLWACIGSCLRLGRTWHSFFLLGCWVDAGLASCCLLRLGGFAGSCLRWCCLSLACCAVVIWLASMGRLDERIDIRGGMASYCVVGMALAGAGGAGWVADVGLCGVTGLAWLVVGLRGGCWVASRLAGSGLGLGRLSLLTWCAVVAPLASGSLLGVDRIMREFVAGLSGLIGRARGVSGGM